MNCVESRLLLHAHVDAELDVANSRELERHLQSCPACSAAQNSLQSLKTALRQSPLRYDAPDSLRTEVRRMARRPGDETRPPLLQSLRLWRSLAFGATAVALAAILLRPAGISEHDRLLNEAVSSHVRSLMVEHLTDVASSDRHTVKPWFNGKLDFAPVVADFAGQGFPLVGGRLDYLNGRTVAALIYRRNKHYINVFIWPAANAGQAPVVENRRGYFVLNHEAGGLHYCLVSDLNAEELAQLAKSFGPSAER
jgi:anti-sigma factor RsiW